MTTVAASPSPLPTATTSTSASNRVTSPISPVNATTATATTTTTVMPSTSSTPSPTDVSINGTSSQQLQHALKRRLSATAREFTPPDGAGVPTDLQFPLITPLSPSHSHVHSEKDDSLPDDAEDEDELELVVDVALAALNDTRHGPSDPNLIASVLLRQVEYYFSNQNLWIDPFLQDQMHLDPEGQGYVPLATVMTLRNISQLAQNDMSKLIQALKSSEKLELNDKQTAVKRKTPLVPYDQHKHSNCTLFVDRLPPGSTIRSVKQMFARFGKVKYVLRADHLLGTSGMDIDKRGKVTHHTSPKGKTRSLSQSEPAGNVANLSSPSLGPRKLPVTQAMTPQHQPLTTPTASPSLTGLGSPLAHLPPAKRNKVIAASTPATSDPEAFSAAFIQFDKSAYCKKAVTHIVSFNKQLKAMTPRSSPRVPPARRGSHSGLSSLPPGVMSSPHGASLTASHVMEQAPASTPPRSRTIKITAASPPTATSSTTTVSTTSASVASPLLHSSSSNGPGSPPRSRLSAMSALTGDHLRPLSPVGVSLPPAHPSSTTSPPPVAGMPPKHTLSPTPPAQQHTGISVMMTPPTGRKMSTTGYESPSFTPITSPSTQSIPFHDGSSSLSEFSLAGDLTAQQQAAASLAPTTPLVTPLPDQFVGLFVMPKISYLRFLKTRPDEAKKSTSTGGKETSTKGETTSSTLTSPIVSPTHVQSSNEPNAASSTASTDSTDSKASKTATAARGGNATTPSTPSLLSASAPAFQPSSISLFQPSAVKPITPVTPLFQPLHQPTQQQQQQQQQQSRNGSSSTSKNSFNPSAAPFISNTSANSPSPPAVTSESGEVAQQGKKKKGKKSLSSADSSDAAKSSGTASQVGSPSLRPMAGRFSLTNARRNSLGQVTAEARQVATRFALGPTSAEAIGFTGGRGRNINPQQQQPLTAISALTQMSAMTLPPAGGGKPL